MPEYKTETRETVGWFCTYTPEEVIYSAGFQPYRLLPHSSSGHRTVEDALPANICPYPRKILSNIRSGLYSTMRGLVVANSCNAMTHLYNVLKEESDLFVYLLDVPRSQDEKAVEYFSRELELFADYLGEQGTPVTEEGLRHALHIYRRRGELLHKLTGPDRLITAGHNSAGLYGLAMEAAGTCPVVFNRRLETMLGEQYAPPAEQGSGSPEAAKTVIVLAGGLPPLGLVEMLCAQPEISLFPENCAGMRYLQKPAAALNPEDSSSRETILRQIARSYLEKPPCPRVFNWQAREDYYRHLFDEWQVRAVIYHDLLFCDMCHYDYLMLKDVLAKKNIPSLIVKSELGEEDLGQLKTRVEAFLEILV